VPATESDACLAGGQIPRDHPWSHIVASVSVNGTVPVPRQDIVHKAPRRRSSCVNDPIWTGRRSRLSGSSRAVPVIHEVGTCRPLPRRPVAPRPNHARPQPVRRLRATSCCAASLMRSSVVFQGSTESAGGRRPASSLSIGGRAPRSHFFSTLVHWQRGDTSGVWSASAETPCPFTLPQTGGRGEAREGGGPPEMRPPPPGQGVVVASVLTHHRLASLP
jgi:hypothetical protein